MAELLTTLAYGALLGLSNALGQYIKNVGLEQFDIRKALPSIAIGTFVGLVNYLSGLPIETLESVGLNFLAINILNNLAVNLQKSGGVKWSSQ